MLDRLFSPRFGVRFDEPVDKGAGGGDGDQADEGKKPEQSAIDEKKPSTDRSQEDEVQKRINELLPERAEQAKRSLIASLGFKDEKALKAALNDLKTRQDGEKTDLEKATSNLGELTTALDQQKAENRRLRIERDVERVATRLKFHKPEEALALIRDSLKDAEIDEDGHVKGVEDLLKKLAKDSSYLIDTVEKPDIDSRTNARKDKTVDEQRLKGRFGL